MFASSSVFPASGRSDSSSGGLKENASVDIKDADSDLDDDLGNNTSALKKSKILDQNSNDEEVASSCMKSEGSSESEDEQMDFSYAPATKPEGEVIHSVRGNDSVAGKRKRDNHTLRSPPPHHTQSGQGMKNWDFGEIASIALSRFTAPTDPDPIPTDSGPKSKDSDPIEIDDGEGGVFDDAEEDIGFEVPTYALSSVPLVRRSHFSPAFRSPAKSSRKKSKSGFRLEEKVKRRRAPHQLNGKKETETAVAIMAGKVDLLEVLPSEDCHFLAKSLWIFTLQQLEAALLPNSIYGEQTGRNLREELLEAVASSDLVEETHHGFGSENLNRQTDDSNEEAHDISYSDGTLGRADTPLSSRKLGSPTMDSQPNHSTKVSNGKFKAAEARLITWARLAAAWRKEHTKDNPHLASTSKRSVEDNFPLDGPISFLLPQGLQNFLATLKISSITQFLSLRKTETGVVTAAFRNWRTLCNLPVVQDVILSKHLIGVTSRVEVAITSLPWADFETRRWMGTELVVLTGAAREFLIDECKIHDPEDFVAQRTKGYADTLEKWRETKNMPPLKGTGKVAMISGWKTNVKDELLITREDGTFFHDVDLLELAEQDYGNAVDLKISKKKERNEAASGKSRTVEKPARVKTALRSPQFFKTVLGHETSSILIATGVDTAEKLFDADKHTTGLLLQKLLEARKSPTSKTYLLSQCTALLHGKLQELNESKDDAIQNKTTIKSPGRPPFKPSGGNQRTRIDSSHRKDPIEALSATARAFLETQGIMLAKDFLTTRTTDIAVAFVPWREANNLPVLKGLGAIASVSGWKATVRKASAEMGFPEYSDVAPKHMPRRTETKTPPPQTDFHPATAIIEPMSNPELLFGNCSSRLAVRCSKGTPMVYVFQLSIRSSRERNETVFLSYLGSKELQANADEDGASDDLFWKDSRMTKFNPILPILAEAQDVTTIDPEEFATSAGFDSFSSNLPGCGIVELTKYGVFPLSRKRVKYGQLFALKREITRFIDVDGSLPDMGNGEYDSKVGVGVVPAERNTTRPMANAFVKTMTSEEGRCFAYLHEPVEKGQVVELVFDSQFSSLEGFDPSKFPTAIRERVGVADLICNLAFEDVTQAVDYLVTETFEKVTTELHEVLLTQGANHALLSVALRKRRRLHWVTSFLLRHGAQVFPSSDALSDAKKAATKKLLWDSEIISKVALVSDSSKSELLKQLTTDVKNEIVFELAARGILNLVADTSLVCFLADECLRSSLDVVASHLTKHDREYTRSNLLADLSAVMAQSVALIMNEESFPSANLELSRRPIRSVVSRSEIVDQKESQATDEECFSKYATSTDVQVPSNMSPVVVSESLGCGFAADSSVVQKRNTDVIDFSGVPEMVLVTRDELATGQASMNRRWYIENQVLFIVHAVVSVGASQWPEIEEACSLLKLRKAAYEAANKNSSCQAELELGEGSPSNSFVDIRLFIKPGRLTANCEPHPLPIFLGTVWPKLSKLGWRLEMGNRPDLFAFLPPGQASSNRKAKDARVKQIKQERVRRRAKLAKEASETGLGYLPKLSKHLFANAVQVDETVCDYEGTTDHSVSVALESFYATVENDLPPEDKNCRSRLRLIIEQIRESFNELAPRLVLTDETPLSAGQNLSPSDLYGCEYLLRFLLVLPGILHEANVPQEELQDTLSVTKELVNFLAKNHKDLFDESFHPPEEELQTELHFQSFLAPRLSKASAKSNESEREEDSKQPYLPEGADAIVLPSDRPFLTNFVEIVMSQFIVCRATVEDAGKKNRRILPDHPGLLCRHCRGDGGEGRYFFSSAESLATAATVLEKHIARCPYIPEDIKTRMVVYRSQHGEQRLTLQSGSLGAYYARLYDRLINSKSGGDPAVYIKPVVDTLKEDQPLSTVSSLSGMEEVTVEFRSHIHVLDYIRRSEEWCLQQEVIDGLKEYYKCLEFGGRIYGTNAMPSQYSAEWVLGKVGPRTKNRFQQQSE